MHASLHHCLIGDPGYSVEEAMSSQTVLTTIRMGRQVAFLKSLDRADERAVLVAKRNYLQVHEQAVSSFVMKRTGGLNRPGVAQGGSERTMRAAKFAALSVANA